MNTGKEVKTKMRKLIAFFAVALLIATAMMANAKPVWVFYGADGSTLAPAGSGDDWCSFSMGDFEYFSNGRISHVIGGINGTGNWVFDENCYNISLTLDGFNPDYDFEAAGINVYLGALSDEGGYYEANLGPIKNGDYVLDFSTFQHVTGPESPHINGVELVVGFGDTYYNTNPELGDFKAGRKYVTYDMVGLNGQFEAHTFYVRNVSTEMVPEPATYAYAAMGLVSMLGLKRRIKK